MRKVILITILAVIYSCSKNDDDSCGCTGVYQSYIDEGDQIRIYPDCDRNAPAGYYFVECDTPDY